jgi:hypothetical protein
VEGVGSAASISVSVSVNTVAAPRHCCVGTFGPPAYRKGATMRCRFTRRCGRLPCAAAVLLLTAAPVRAEPSAGARPSVERPIPTFAYRSQTEPALAYSRAYHWLRGRGPIDADLLRRFNAVWESDRPLIDKTAATLALGDEGAAELLAAARDPERAVPTALPPQLRDRDLPDYFRANLTLAYAKELCARRAFEEARDALRAGGDAAVVDPALYFFLSARAAHALMLPQDARLAIEELLDVTDAPERYRALAHRMEQDMDEWRDKNLHWVARRMGQVARRLELGRVNGVTVTRQKEIVARLDEMIRELENRAAQSEPPEPACPKK